MNDEPTYDVVFETLEDFLYLLNSVVVGDSTIEDLILLVGTLVAFIAFILWCCFPVQPKETSVQVLYHPDRSSKDEKKYNQINREENDLAES